ncbi:hypothetical protein JG687_00019495 [Phytophthora cactorum]|uniref:Uncharacterized protein n=1 Tax=Phytophthora cactorum TaxID=29920 RepID=A0A8T1TKY2_9STRA|nr:hypothetical protein JG687_00019495 [Phytophthora cactorum]
MKKAHTSVTNYLPELPKRTFIDRTEFNHALADYTAEHYLCFRVRSSETRAKHNMYMNSFRHGITQLPPKMTYNFKRMYAVVVDGQAKWQVSVAPGSEISLHNHKANKRIYDSYHGAKSELLSHLMMLLSCDLEFYG